MVDAMAKDGAARLRLRPVGAADRKKLPEYGPLGTGCPAIERAVAALYKGQNEESFWALMNAINYALELDTRVLVPLEAASDQPDGAGSRLTAKVMRLLQTLSSHCAKAATTATTMIS